MSSDDGALLAEEDREYINCSPQLSQTINKSVLNMDNSPQEGAHCERQGTGGL